MSGDDIVSSDDLRASFTLALSEMYCLEVPQYGSLVKLVADINRQSSASFGIDSRHRMEVERHGAIRLGTDYELSTMKRLFSIMGMYPVGYYDLAVAGLPVHATCFRPIDAQSLARNPFRVFTSLLRLDLIEDLALRKQASEILRQRQIFTPRCLELIDKLELRSVFSKKDARELIQEALETFRWHKTSTVDERTYQALKDAHPLIADVVCFRGPHINHLTPRVLDIDTAQAEMQRRGLHPKETIEGPPPRHCPILLRQTSFLALEEPIAFSNGTEGDGKHKARFGEIEQRGVALTQKGRRLYDELVTRSRQSASSLVDCFKDFPDDLQTLRREGLAFFTYALVDGPVGITDASDFDTLVDSGAIRIEPITYEDFLPISAAGIFQSNLGGKVSLAVAAPAKLLFERALGSAVHDEYELYASIEKVSMTRCKEAIASVIKTRSVA